MYVLLFLPITTVLGANILHIELVGGRSHHIWNRALAIGLVKKGHNVTMISHSEEEQNLHNFNIIQLEGFYNIAYDSFSLDSISETDAFWGIKSMYDYSLYTCEYDFASEGLKRLLNYPKDFVFDLIIIDITLQQCVYPLIERFNNPPVVAVTPFLLPPALAQVFGNPLQTAYVPFYSTNYTDRMSFLERIKNFLLVYSDVMYRKYINTPGEMKLAKKYFGDNIRPFEEVERNMSILISNHDPILGSPVALAPNIIPVGGMHVGAVKPLPNDLKTIVDKAEHGLIIFTLGSYLRSDQLSVAKRTAILEAFGKLPQTIFWKFESEIQNLPKNVIIRKWLPQNDLLGNPKTKLLITHGGGLSTQEAMCHGIPIIAIPFHFDQHANAGKLVNRKMAKILNYNEISTESLYSVITEVINNPMYTKNIKELSQRYRGASENPLNRAVYWVEYVLQHRTAKFLNLASRDMPMYQSATYDVVLVLILGIYMLYSIIYFVIIGVKLICRIVCK